MPACGDQGVETLAFQVLAGRIVGKADGDHARVRPDRGNKGIHVKRPPVGRIERDARDGTKAECQGLDGLVAGQYDDRVVSRGQQREHGGVQRLLRAGKADQVEIGQTVVTRSDGAPEPWGAQRVGIAQPERGPTRAVLVVANFKQLGRRHRLAFRRAQLVL